MEIGLTDNQWIEYGRFLKQLHTTRLPEPVLELMPKESFIPKWSGVVGEIHEKIMRSNPFGHLSENELASFWMKKEVEIKYIVNRADELGKRLQGKSLEFNLCHADIHIANLLLTQASKIHVVDWDGVILAPKERDLMFIVGTTVGGISIESEEEGLFFQGYGQTQIDPIAMAYYRYEWVVQEIGDYGERVFLLAEVGDETKADAVRGFKEMFQPGNIVESAYVSEAGLLATGG